MKFRKLGCNLNLSNVSCLEIGNKIWFHQIDIILGFNLIWNIYLSICWIFHCDYSLYVKILGLDNNFSCTMLTIFTSIESLVFLFILIAVFIKTINWLDFLRNPFAVQLATIMLLVDTFYTVCFAIDMYRGADTVLNQFWRNDFNTKFPERYDYHHGRESYGSQMITRTFWVLPAVLIFKLISAAVIYQNKQLVNDA